MTAADLTPPQQVEFAELMTPLVSKIASEMRKERGAEVLTDGFLYALACRAAVAAGAYTGDPRSILRSVERRACPSCGTEFRHAAGGRSAIHRAGCDWQEGSSP